MAAMHMPCMEAACNRTATGDPSAPVQADAPVSKDDLLARQAVHGEAPDELEAAAKQH